MELTPGAVQQGSQIVDQQLGIEIARYVFGRQAEFRRRAALDTQVQTAIGLLRKAQSPKELLGLAVGGSRPAPARN